MPEPDLDDPITRNGPKWISLGRGPKSVFCRRKSSPSRLWSPTEAQLTLRLDREVLDHFRATGPGGQSRINTALKALVQKA